VSVPAGLLVAMLGIAGSVHAQAPGLRAFKPEDVQWVQRRHAPDVFHATLYGDPSAAGPYAYRIRAQSCHVLPPHTHPDERTVTVLSGTYWSAWAIATNATN
jgi:hypothetical protein